MFPLLPFVAGVVAGAVALRLVKADKAKAGLEKAQDKLRDATVTSLEVIEQASARARQRLAATEDEAQAVPAEPAPAAAEAKPVAKRAPRKAAPRARKAAAKPAAEPAEGEAGKE